MTAPKKKAQMSVYLDPDVMKMQFQMSSMKTVGDPIMYFTMYPGRFASAHLQGVDTTTGQGGWGPRSSG